MGRLKSIVDRIHDSILGHQRQEEKIVEAAHNQNDDEEIAELDRKIESQEAAIKEVEGKSMEAQKEYLRRQELVAMQNGRREVQGNNRPLSETERMLRKLMCPICRNRERNCVLRQCGHAVCRNCLEGKLCPVCRRPFVKADVIGLIFGK
jgi:E3 ubiquitin-protein ligase BRE1